MRRTITISVSEDMHTAIVNRAQKQLFSSVSEYIRLLVRDDMSKGEADQRAPARLPLTANERMAAALRGSDL